MDEIEPINIKIGTEIFMLASYVRQDLLKEMKKLSKNPVFPYVMLKAEEIKAETIAENNEKVISSILNIISSSIQLI